MRTIRSSAAGTWRAAARRVRGTSVRLVACMLLAMCLLARGLYADERASVEVPDEVATLFTSLQLAVNSEEAKGVLALFDMPAMAKRLRLRPGMRALLASEDDETAARQLAEATVRMTLRQAHPILYPYQQFRFMRFELDVGDRTATVHVRMRGAHGWQRCAFWIAKRGGGWQIIDLEYMEITLRLTTAIDAGTRLGFSLMSKRDPRLYKALHDLMEALELSAHVHSERAIRLLRGIPNGLLPRELEVPRLVLLADERLLEGDGAGALKLITRARRLKPESSFIERLRGTALMCLERHEEGIKSLNAFIARSGPDVLTYTLLAISHWRLAQTKRARELIHLAVEDDPGDGMALAWLGMLLRKEDRGGAILRVSELSPRVEQFSALAETVLAQSRAPGPLLLRFAHAYRQLNPEDAIGHYYAGVALRLADNLDGALPLLEQALYLAPEGDGLAAYQQPLLEILAGRGQATAAYKKARDKGHALWHLGSGFMAGGNVKDLESLLKHVSGDPALAVGRQRAVYAAYVEFHRGRYDAVIKLLKDWLPSVQEAFDSSSDDAPFDPYLLFREAENLLFRAYVRTGRIEIAEAFAAPIVERDDDPRYRALIRLAQGEFERALDRLDEALGDSWWQATEMLADPDIKKHFHQESLKAFHAKLIEAAKDADR